MSQLQLTPALRRLAVVRTPRGGLLGLLRALAGLARQRRRLRDLDAHLLSDIGLSPEAAEREARRRIWDVPAHWRL